MLHFIYKSPQTFTKNFPINFPNEAMACEPILQVALKHKPCSSLQGLMIHLNFLVSRTSVRFARMARALDHFLVFSVSLWSAVIKIKLCLDYPRICVLNLIKDGLSVSFLCGVKMISFYLSSLAWRTDNSELSQTSMLLWRNRIQITSVQ